MDKLIKELGQTKINNKEKIKIILEQIKSIEKR